MNSINHKLDKRRGLLKRGVNSHQKKTMALPARIRLVLLLMSIEYWEPLYAVHAKRIMR